MRKVLLLALLVGCARPQPAPAPAPAPAAKPPAPASQNPSPMRELTRRHERLAPDTTAPGIRFRIDSVLPKPVDVFVPQRAMNAGRAPLWIHFMGATWVARTVAAQLDQPVIVAATYLGAGSGVYARPFANDSLLYQRLLDSIAARLAAIPGAPRIERTYLSGWSAGYGAIREILRRPANLPHVDGALLLDGIHTSYLPDGKPLADGGAIDTTGLTAFADFARRAARGEKRFIVTHSEIFPGTFASTTECSDWLLSALGLARVPVLEWGPLGAQLLSRTTQGRFEVLGYAGNAAPDHIDLFQGMAPHVARLLAP